MPPPDPTLSKPDRARLAHMRKAAKDAIVILGDDDEQTIANDMIRTRALVNCFTEIGEAAARTSRDARALAIEIPWGQIVGMRHNLVSCVLGS